MDGPAPTGTVTFLFTDMEGSTSLWQRYRLHMPHVLRRHDEILRSAVEAHEGYVFKMIGDACCAAFSDPMDAIKAALDAQRALLAERWSGNVPVRVRMALHHGHAAEQRSGDYFGPPVNLVARLLSLARGGQVLLSGVVAELVSDELPHFIPEAKPRDLGERRLKDIIRPVRVYQLLSPELLRVEGLEEEDEEEERYHIERLLGEGGMARVFLAYDQELDSPVALKVLREDYAEEAHSAERFRREARSAASLRGHPNIVTIYDRGRTTDGSYYLAMEYLPGGSLKDYIKREGPLGAHQSARLALQVAQALKHSHQRGLVHRDVKPQNVLLTERGEVKVADFGIAKAMDATAITGTGSVLGTAQYLSPEQALGQPASSQSDLYSLGVMLYEMLTGEVPYEAPTPAAVLMKHVSEELRPPKEVNAEVPEHLNEVTVRLLAKDPKERYSDAGELVEDLERVLRSLEDHQEHATQEEAAKEHYREAIEEAWTDEKLSKEEAQRLSALANELGLSPDAAGEIEREVTGDTVRAIFQRQIREEHRRHLDELYAQARRSYQNREWWAVVTAFEQIHSEAPTYPDPEGLLQSAREALERERRVARLYDRGRHHVEAEEWWQALKCFEEVQRLKPGYGDTEELLSRVRRELAPPPTVEVPNLGGQRISQASSTLASKGLKLSAHDEVSSDTVPEGEIVGQSPQAGTKVQAGSSVSVTVSSSPHEVIATPPPDYQAGEHTDGTERVQRLLPALAGSWWVLALRGLVMVIFGLELLFFYGTGEFRLYGGLMLIADGLFAIIDAKTRAGRGRQLSIQGRISGLAGLFVLFVWLVRDTSIVSDINASAQTFLESLFDALAIAPRLIGSWAIFIGLIRMIAAFQLRWETRNLLLMGTSSVSLIVFGVLLWPEQPPGETYSWSLLGSLALASGITLVAVALRVRDREERGSRVSQE